MKHITKFLSVLITMTIIFLSISLMSFALEPEETFDINDVTWDDIMTMSNSEFRKLLSDFERVYDPFGTYENESITGTYGYNMNTETVQPLWTSGNTDISGNIKETGSHELITARACGILLDNKGFWGSNRNASIVIALTISLASILPDRESSTGVSTLFAGHFYDPDTGKNWAKDATDTARTNAVKNYTEARNEYNKNGTSDEFIKYVGRMLHYVQDACEPHHAANIVSLGPLSAHSKFEDFADEHLNSYIDAYTIPSNNYSNALNKSISNIVHEAAVTAKSYSDLVKSASNQTHWNMVAQRTTRNAVLNTALVLYNLSIKTGIPLYQ